MINNLHYEQFFSKYTYLKSYLYVTRNHILIIIFAIVLEFNGLNLKYMNTKTSKRHETLEITNHVLLIIFLYVLKT